MQSKIYKFSFSGKLILVGLIFLLLNAIQTAQSQSPVLLLGSGLNTRVNCSCTDSVGNIYAVTSVKIDTTAVYRWTIATKTWSLYAKIPGFYTSNYSACAILYNKLYLNGGDFSTSSEVFLEFNGTKKIIGTYNSKVSNVQMNIVKFKNRLYFIGPFDSINNTTKMPGIAVYNGSTFSNAGFPASYVVDGLYFGTGDINTDTLYLSYGDKILKHVAPSTWSVFYKNTTKKTFNSLALHNNLVHASIENKILVVRQDTKIDSINVPNKLKRLSLMEYKNQMFIASLENQNAVVMRLSSANKLYYCFNNQLTDTNRISFVKNNTGLYYHGTNNVKVNGISYNYIAQINVDSLANIGFDTIVGSSFWDKNNNYKFDIKDTTFSNIIFRNLNEDYTVATNKNGVFTDIVPDTKNVTYQFQSLAYTDTCLQQNFSGNLISNNFGLKTRDSLTFPLRRTSSSDSNLILNTIYSNYARLNDTINFAISVAIKGCSFYTYDNGKVIVKLDPKTNFISSVPVYTSKVGNTLVYDNLTFNYLANNFINMKVYYSNSQYKFRDTVTHYAKLVAIASDDSSDNTDSVVQIMTYSYDPNVKHSLPEGKITKELKSIRYFIDFQNLGNDYAKTVRVVDTLNTKMPVYEFKMIAASHPYKVSLQPGTSIVTWIFDNINLKPKSIDEKGSKGYIIFDAKVRGDLKVGDSITNKASIYFDYNDPVITNYAVISMVKIVPPPPPNVISKINAKLKTLNVYPNPTQTDLKIENTDTKSQTIRVFDINGKLLQTLYVAPSDMIHLSTLNWSSGLYFILSDTGESFKLIKE